VESSRATINQLFSSESSLKTPFKKPIEKNEMCGLLLCEMAMLTIIDYHTCLSILGAAFFSYRTGSAYSFLCGLHFHSFLLTLVSWIPNKEKHLIVMFNICSRTIVFLLPNCKIWHARIQAQFVQKILDTLGFLPTFSTLCFHSSLF